MFDYLQQFNKLPKELREKVSSPAAMEILSSLEAKYGVSLAMVVMQVMIKQILVKDLAGYFVSEMGLEAEKAQSLSRELQERLFFNVSAYLGLRSSPVLSAEDKELEILMKENGIVLPSQDMIARCRQILLTYRKGVRTKIDALSALQRPVAQGGLSLEAAAADRLLRALDRPTSPSPAPVSKPVPSAINDLIEKNEAAAYDLKTALAKGQVKPPEVLADRYKVPKLDVTHEISAPKPELAIAAPEAKPIAAPVTPTVQVEKPVEKKEEKKVEDTPPPLQPKVEKAEKEQPAVITAPAKTPAKGGLWTKLFKESPAKTDPATPVATRHLEEAVKAAAANNNLTARPAASSQSRPKMDDVKVKPKVMGPLEELRFMDLLNFRRLSNSPKECTAKVVMKIKLLEKDGYERMVEGVKAWRQSPVNRLYVRLAHEAVVKDITLRDAVAARSAEGKEALTMEEIEAIVAMNNQLMF